MSRCHQVLKAKLPGEPNPRKWNPRQIVRSTARTKRGVYPGDTSSRTGAGKWTGRAPESWIGTTLGRYEIVGVLGQGGMGLALKARDPMIDREVAIKLLSDELAADPKAVQRFLAEARAAGRLSHPNTVSIYEVGQEGSAYYLVMEFIAGGAIAKDEAQGSAFSVAQATQIMLDACRGVAAAHGAGLVHRDIKPANLLQAEDGAIKVADFGLAKIRTGSVPTMTNPGQIMGTPYFMSPEQCESKPVDGRSDIYSLGATYYSLLTGRDPYSDSESMVQVMFAHCHADVPEPRDVNSQIPAACSAIIARAMAKSPEDRYQTIEEMLADLETLTAGQTVAVAHQRSALMDRKAVEPGGRPHAGQHLGMLATAGLMALACALGIGWYLSSRRDAPVSPEAGNNQAAMLPLAQGVTATTITFGTTTVYSGPSRDLGQNMVLGIRTCFQATNEAGGVHGRKLELLVLDDGYEPERALANMEELFESRKVFAVIGNVGTPTAKVTVPYALEHQYLFFAPFSGASLLRREPPDRYVFNYRASYGDETAAMVTYFVEVKEIAANQIAVFAQNDAYGDDEFHGVVRALRHYGVHEADILRVNYDRNSLQVSEAVEQIAKHADRLRAVVMVPTYAVAARFIQQLKSRRLDLLFGVVSFVGSDMLAQELRAIGPEYAKGVIVTQVVPHYESSATGVLRYRKLLAKHFPEARPSFVSLEGFIAAECLVEGLRQAGPQLTTERLIDAFESIHDLDLGIGPIIRFGPSRHQASTKVWGTVFNDSAELRILDLD